jgi:hypothetical protein
VGRGSMFVIAYLEVIVGVGVVSNADSGLRDSRTWRLTHEGEEEEQGDEFDGDNPLLV